VNSHRNESRGIGGIFFDDLKASKSSFGFVKDCGNLLTDLYIPILQKRIYMDFDDEMKRWQQIRRGRYVEFNLVFGFGIDYRFGYSIDNRYWP
jgi:coproporphyrinogen III oxidase